MLDSMKANRNGCLPRNTLLTKTGHRSDMIHDHSLYSSPEFRLRLRHGLMQENASYLIFLSLVSPSMYWG